MTKKIIRKARGLSDKAIAWIFVLPTILLLLAINIYPLIYAVTMSFTNFYANKVGKEVNWVGLKNYVKVLGKESVWERMQTTANFMFWTLLFQALIGLCLALLLNRKFKGLKTMDTLLGERIPITQKIKKGKNYLLNNNILIAIHSFSDAPHVFGNTVFADNYEWLRFLAKESKKNNKFNWLLKVHPIFYDKEISIVNNILKEYPHIKILPKFATHQELIKKGIRFVLTVYGSVAYEYAYFGIPSILATKNHPYKKYNFVKDAGTINEYKKLLENLENLKFTFSKKEILEYYFMRFVRVNRLFKNYYKIVQILGSDYTSPLIYKFWLKEYNEKKNNKIIQKLNSYVNSKDYSFEYYN